MGNTVVGLSVDAADAAGLATFWADTLGSDVDPGASTDYAAVGGTPRLVFHRVPEGKELKNRLHLDLLTGEFEAELARLLSLGASRVGEIREGTAHWITLADPEGNEFDLIDG
jgi:catechol-2,3-dioxygenase